MGGEFGNLSLFASFFFFFNFFVIFSTFISPLSGLNMSEVSIWVKHCVIYVVEQPHPESRIQRIH